MLFLATGEEPLQHDDQMEIVQRILKNATKLYQFLPITLGLGVSAVMPRITSQELRDLSSVLKKPGDDRQGQLVRNYDRFYAFILELIHKYQLDPPELFRNNEIDRTALLFYNTDKKVDDYVFSHNLIR